MAKNPPNEAQCLWRFHAPPGSPKAIWMRVFYRPKGSPVEEERWIDFRIPYFEFQDTGSPIPVKQRLMDFIRSSNRS
jgi:hypothetical protein